MGINEVQLFSYAFFHSYPTHFGISTTFLSPTNILHSAGHGGVAARSVLVPVLVLDRLAARRKWWCRD